MKRRTEQPVVGILEWFRPGEHERVAQVLADLRTLGVTQLRTGISWADWHGEGGEEWYEWLFPELAKQLNVLPCFLYTPPSLGVMPKTSAPPRDPKTYADFIDQMITLFGEYFDWVELWNEPNNLREWDVTLDPEWHIFSEMVGGAAYWAKSKGKKTLLGGISPIDPNWIKLMSDRGVLEFIDAVGIHGFPGTFDYSWDGWGANVSRICEVLRQCGSSAEIWITETGFSTRRHDEQQQVREFIKAAEADVARVYWYSAHDLDPDLPTVDGFHLDERDYHFGIRRADGSPKLLFRIWASGGLNAVREAAWMAEPAKALRTKHRPVLITGGAGFIGTNLAHRLLGEGKNVLIYDSLARPGVEQNLNWLRQEHPDNLRIQVADVRDKFALRRAVNQASQVFHLAAQVAVTTSLTGPIVDFDINLRGTLNLLEAIRAADNPPPLVFTSTNKVYGRLDSVALLKDSTRYTPADPVIRARGIAEDRQLDFHSPYGCSKGAADQYVIDYGRIYGLPTVVFRMSCIYGPHQFGTEDQGWVAHFLIRALQEQPVTIYGDGLQVRDVLFVDDLVNAFLLAQENIDTVSGEAFNIGGGPGNTLSILELLEMVAELRQTDISAAMDGWRPGDQRYYVSDTSKFRAATGWSGQTGVREGVSRLYEWLAEQGSIAAAARQPGGMGHERERIAPVIDE